MTDIVERLRHPVGIVTARAVDLYNEAADEIERLRKALGEIRESGWRHNQGENCDGRT